MAEFPILQVVEFVITNNEITSPFDIFDVVYVNEFGAPGIFTALFCQKKFGADSSFSAMAEKVTADPSQIVVVAEILTLIGSVGLTVIVPFISSVPVHAVPVNEIEKLKGLPSDVVGVPEIVIIPPVKDPVTPAGSPVKTAFVASVVYVIGVIPELTQTLWLFVPAGDVNVVLHVCPHTLTPIIHNPTPAANTLMPLISRICTKLFT